MEPNQKIIYSIIERFAKETERMDKTNGSLVEALDIKAREVVSLVGAGGKTTLLFRLAKELVLGGKKVVTTTTTKILEPTSEETPILFIDPDEEKIGRFIEDHIHQYSHITIAGERLESGKLKGISTDRVDRLCNSYWVDTVIVEADGASRRPVKAPRQGEPVIPSRTTLVVALLGIDGMETELNGENVFQPELVSKMTGIPLGGRMTDEGMAVLMTHPEGIFKGTPSTARVVAFLNKVDIPNGISKAKRVAQKILEKKHRQIERVVLGQLEKEPPVVGVILQS
jgi:probable selenium-dependent hydroxylase accessory protein YqeC